MGTRPPFAVLAVLLAGVAPAATLAGTGVPDPHPMRPIHLAHTPPVLDPQIARQAPPPPAPPVPRVRLFNVTPTPRRRHPWSAGGPDRVAYEAVLVGTVPRTWPPRGVYVTVRVFSGEVPVVTLVTGPRTRYRPSGTQRVIVGRRRGHTVADGNDDDHLDLAGAGAHYGQGHLTLARARALLTALADTGDADGRAPEARLSQALHAAAPWLHAVAITRAPWPHPLLVDRSGSFASVEPPGLVAEPKVVARARGDLQAALAARAPFRAVHALQSARQAAGTWPAVAAARRRAVYALLRDQARAAGAAGHLRRARRLWQWLGTVRPGDGEAERALARLASEAKARLAAGEHHLRDDPAQARQDLRAAARMTGSADPVHQAAERDLARLPPAR